MEEENKYEQIEQYLAGGLSDSERSDFEQQLENDSALEQEVQLHEQVAQTLRGEQVHQLRSALKSVDQSWDMENPQTDKAQSRVLQLPFRKVIILAASLLALVFAYYTFSPNTSLSPTDLYADNFTPYKMVLNQRSTSESISDPATFSAAITAYDNKDFAQAATLFQTLQTAHPEIIAFSFYQAIANLSQKNTSIAIASLQKILATPDHLFVEQSRWYLGLAYLQAGDLDQAKLQLEQIEEGGYQYAAAQQVLRGL